MWKAAKRGNLTRVRELAASDQTPGNGINERHPRYGTTSLMVAADRKHPEVVCVLLQCGADANIVDNTKRKNTALHYAAHSNNITAIEYLLSAGANIFALNGKGHTPLDVARLRRRREAVELLTKHLEVHSGWLWMRSGFMWPLWTRRWVTVLSCNITRTSSELCVFREAGDLFPDAVLTIDESACARTLPTQVSFVWLNKANAFTLDRPILYQHMSRRFWRDQMSGLTHSHGFVQSREFSFAADSENARQLWMRILAKGSTPNFAPSSVYSTPAASAAVSGRGFDSSEPMQVEVGSRSPPSAPPSSTRTSYSQYNSSPTSPGFNLLFPSPSPMSHLNAMSPAHQPTIEPSPLPVPSAPNLSFIEDNYAEAPKDITPSDGMVRKDCVVCMEAPRNAICVPCGHMAGCHACLLAVTSQNPSCPICRTHVDSVVKVYEC